MSTLIRFRLNTLKTVQVAAMFLELHGGTMKYLGLLKLLYLAERVALKRLERPLSGDKYFSMDFGSVLSTTYDLSKNKPIPEAIDIWKRYISTRDEASNYVVELLENPGIDELSSKEEEIIREVYQKCGNYDRLELAELTHTKLREVMQQLISK